MDDAGSEPEGDPKDRDQWRNQQQKRVFAIQYQHADEQECEKQPPRSQRHDSGFPARTKRPDDRLISKKQG